MKLKLGLLVLLSPLVLVFLLRSGEHTYPHPELLIEPAQLARRDLLKHCVILDTRARSRYEQGHVPNAQWVDPGAWGAAFGQGKDVEGWSRKIGELGIGPGSHVVVYDDNFSLDAAHVWWMLRYWGVEDVRLMDGGWTGWTTRSYPTVKGSVVPPPVRFVLQAHSERLATKEQLLRSLKSDDLQLVDARSGDEYRGVDKRNNSRAGAIPGAKQLEWIDLLDRQTHCFKSPADLHKLFADAGIALDRPTAVYCQSGVRAAVTAFVLELMGAREVSNYHPGWSEWSKAEDSPVVPGNFRVKN